MHSLFPTSSQFFLTSDHTLIHFEQLGTGPHKILFLMGFLLEGRAFAHQLSFFEQHPEFQCCVFDNRGVGRSDRPWGVYSTTRMAQDATELMDHMGWQCAHIVGVSMGGMIAQELAVACPEKVQSLTLMVTHAGGPLAWIHPWAVYLVGKAALVDVEPEEKVKTLLHLLYKKSTIEDKVKFAESLNFHLARRKHTASLSVSSIVGHFIAVSTHHVAFERLYQFRKQPFQTFVVGPDGDDLLVLPCHSKFIHDAVNGKFWLAPSAHGVIGEAKDELHPKLKDFFLQNTVLNGVVQKVGHLGCLHRGPCYYNNVKLAAICYALGAAAAWFFCLSRSKLPNILASFALLFKSGVCIRNYFEFMIKERIFSGFLHIPYPSFLFFTLSAYYLAFKTH